MSAITGAGILRVGLTEDYRPFSFADASGKVEGIDVDMAMNLAQSLDVRALSDETLTVSGPC
jgi:ABC-type amino acid transport substrate-binding protein